MQEHVEVDQKHLVLLTRALRAEGDGKTLSRELVRELKAVVEPAAAAARAAILSMGSTSDTEPGLRTTVARMVKTGVRTTGKHPGVFIRAKKTGMPRNFNNAPKRLNATKGWRHTVFGNDQVWVTQRGKPGWFDDTIAAFKPAAIRAAQKVMDDMARRIDFKTRG